MARVPIQTDNLVQAERSPNLRLQAFDGGGGVGGGMARGLVQLGGALSDAAETQARINRQQDEASAKQAFTEYSGFRTARLHTDDDALFGQQGAAALAARKPVEQQLDDRLNQISRKIGNPVARRLFEQAARQERERDSIAIANFVTKQAEVYNDQQDTALQIQSRNDAIAAQLRGDADSAQVAMGTWIGSIRSQAARKGMFGAPAQVAEAKAITDFHATVVEQMAVGDPVAANGYLERHRDQIKDLDTLTKLDKMLREPLEEQEFDQAANMFRGVATPGAVEGYRLPVQGAVTSAFGMRQHPIDGGVKLHKGIDIAAVTGAPVGAAASGTVIFAGPKGGYGNYVMVRHSDGSETAYAHLSKIGVEVGDQLASGQILGAVGQTGKATGPHLHFETYHDGKAVDPAKLARTEGVAAKNGPRENDLNAQLAAVDTYAAENGWPFRKVQGVKNSLMRQDALDRRLKADEEQRAYVSATSKMIELGRQFTSVSQIGPDFVRLSPEQQMRVQGVAKANLKPEPIKTNDATFWALRQLEARDPKNFARLDPFKLRTKLSDADFRSLIERQAEVIGRDGKLTPKAVERSRLFSVAKDALQAAGIDTGDSKEARKPKNARRKLDFLDDMAASAAAWTAANPGKVPPDDEIRKWAGNLLLRVSGTGSSWFGDGEEHLVFEASDKELAAGISAGDRARATAALRKRGLPVTDATIADVYRRAGVRVQAEVR